MSNLPIKIDKPSANYIVETITRKDRKKNTRHLLEDRLIRLETVGQRSLKTDVEVKKYLKNFLSDAELYFSFLKISPFRPLVENSYSMIAEQINDFFIEANKYIQKIKKQLKNKELKIPLAVVGHKLSHYEINETMYIYCIKGKNVLILAGEIKGKLAPQDFIDYWHLFFDYKSITFLNFEDTADHIRTSIENDDRLKNYNSALSWFFPFFEAQANEVENHRIKEEIDKNSLSSLSLYQKKILGIYMPIFDRYGDADSRIMNLCDKILSCYKELYPKITQWVIYSPSYCLPIWFVDFFSYLSNESQVFLEELDLNKWTSNEIIHIVDLLDLFLNNKTKLNSKL